MVCVFRFDIHTEPTPRPAEPRGPSLKWVMIYEIRGLRLKSDLKKPFPEGNGPAVRHAHGISPGSPQRPGAPILGLRLAEDHGFPHRLAVAPDPHKALIGGIAERIFAVSTIKNRVGQPVEQLP